MVTEFGMRQKKLAELMKRGLSEKQAKAAYREQVLEPALEEKKKVERETFAKAEAERAFQERKKEREASLSIPKQEVLQETPVTELKTEEEKTEEIEEEKTEEQPQQEYYIDQATGEKTPLYSGTVTPVTAEDITDIVTSFSGLGLFAVGIKGAGKQAAKKGGRVILSSAKAQIVKKSMVKAISKALRSKIALFVGGAMTAQIGGFLIKEFVSPYILDSITAEDRRIRSIDAGLSQVRETITLPVQLANANAPIEDCLEQIDNLRLIVEIADSKIKELEIGSQERKTNPEFTLPMKLRIQKLRGFLDLAERQILLAQAREEAITDEQLNEIMETYALLFPNE